MPAKWISLEVKFAGMARSHREQNAASLAFQSGYFAQKAGRGACNWSR